jgi:hypothetical protein
VAILFKIGHCLITTNTCYNLWDSKVGYVFPEIKKLLTFLQLHPAILFNNEMSKLNSIQYVGLLRVEGDDLCLMK